MEHGSDERSPRLSRRWLTLSLAGIPLELACRKSVDILDGGARVEQLSGNMFAIIHDDATDEWPHSNVGVIVGRRSVFVIDSNYLPSRARGDITLISRITDRPVSMLATTHWPACRQRDKSALLFNRGGRPRWP